MRGEEKLENSFWWILWLDCFLAAVPSMDSKGQQTQTSQIHTVCEWSCRCSRPVDPQTATSCCCCSAVRKSQMFSYQRLLTHVWLTLLMTKRWNLEYLLKDAPVAHFCTMSALNKCHVFLHKNIFNLGGTFSEITIWGIITLSESGRVRLHSF